ncbi:M48 family peptidase [Leptospira gomenensis]|uniref:M48 family peptidase n=1 Tax=Leptospira gomenensis TaxID=2484974 RepID=A0A5F1Y8F4_9LEPT|nr:M48 family metallopeptidase [Leptospira gomenensis]TGK29444.1 M48 family peptidase [Leptospira gomenensis]TGK33653.1 M48 family peptidase [Leptospira gomenensis]TGK44894.1 M48 family peptidase [Leptospira gomenensis]TGK64515.1 M48 family peptidase [Leptospira gomenensis]
MKLRTVLFIFYLIQIGFTLTMKYLSYEGDVSPELKERILKFFTEEDLRKGIEYSRSGFFASILSDLIDFIVAGIFVFTSVSARLEEKISEKTGGRFYITVLLFFFGFSAIQFLLAIPFQYYFGFVLEHRFGFSKMTFVEWLVYTGKSLGLGIVGGALGVLCVAFLLKKFENAWKFLVPIASLVFGLLFSVLFPILITPLFYDYKPIAEGSLKKKINTLCETANIRVENVYVIDESRYSGHTNAYFTGWGENRKIFLYDTLIQNHTEEEIVSVLGHEIGHWTHNHQIKDIALNTLEIFLLCFLLGYLFLRFKKEGSVRLKEFYSPSTLPFLFLLLSLFGSLTRPAWSAISRFQETQADEEALNLTGGDKKSFIDTEVKLAKDNRSRLNPNRAEVIYYHSHPTTLERIEFAQRWKK